MISFKMFFENSMGRTLMSVPIKVMGLSSDMNALPPDPYGFWVDKSGNFINVPTADHSYVAIDMIEKANEYLQGNLSGETGKPYTYLFNNGFLRLIEVSNTLYYETMPGGEPTPAQWKFMNYIKDYYGYDEVRVDYH